MARTKNYEVLIAAKEENIHKVKEKLATLEAELQELKDEQKSMEVSELYDAVKKSGLSVNEIMDMLNK